MAPTGLDSTSSATKRPQAPVKESLVGRPSLFGSSKYEGTNHNSARAEIRTFSLRKLQMLPVSLQRWHVKHILFMFGKYN